MKILKKPKIPVQTCKNCGCVVKITPKDLICESVSNYTTPARDFFKCPICDAENKVRFEKENKLAKEKESMEAAEC